VDADIYSEARRLRHQVVAITDNIGATTLPSNEQFWTVKSARDGQVLRGVAIVPQDFGNGRWDH
jgi:hypothetical protein